MMLTVGYVMAGAVLAAVLASFGCVVGERGWRGAATGRSHCVCGRELHAWENVPIVGWLAAGGRARCCGAPLPARYLWCETGAAVAGAGAGAASSAGMWPVAAMVAVAAVLVPAAVCRSLASRPS